MVDHQICKVIAPCCNCVDLYQAKGPPRKEANEYENDSSLEMVVVSKPIDRIQRLKKRFVAACVLLAVVALCLRNIASSGNATKQHRRRIDLLEKFPVVTNRTDFTIDLLSVGSVLRSDLQDAQERTFAADPSVRHWVRLTEHNDYEHNCASSMTAREVGLLWQTCKETIWVRKISQTIRGQLYTANNHTGWICAQKRPLEGLYQMLDRYRTKQEALPDYLILVEDDTYINTAQVASVLQEKYSSTDPNLLSGCITSYPERQQLVFPTRGTGTMLSKVAIHNMLKPIYCDVESPDIYSVNACWRMGLNIMGERDFFREGMSLIDLMVEYSRAFEFSQVHAWKPRTGFCLTSETALGYFIASYHIGAPEASLKATPNDFMRKKYGFTAITADGRCDNSCSRGSLVCHGLSAKEMDKLYKESK